VGSCEHGNQSLGPLKCIKFLNCLRKHQALKRDPWAWCLYRTSVKLTQS